MADLGTVSILVDVRGQPIVKDLAKDLNNVATAEKQVSAATQKVMADFKRMQAITAMLKKTTDDTSNSFQRFSATELQQATQRMRGFESSLANTRRGMGQMGMATQQVGYQVGDFLVQIQSGTSAFVAFGQQATQLVGILPAFSKQLGMSVGSLIGISSVLGIAIPLATAFGAAWMRTSEEVKEGADKQKQAYDSVKQSIESLQLARQMASSGAQTESEQSVLNTLNAALEERKRLLEESLALEYASTNEASLQEAAARAELSEKQRANRLAILENEELLKSLGYERELEIAARRRANEKRNEYREAEALRIEEEKALELARRKKDAFHAMAGEMGAVSSAMFNANDGAAGILSNLVGATNAAMGLRDALGQVESAASSRAARIVSLTAQINAASRGGSVGAAQAQAETATQLAKTGASLDQIATAAQNAGEQAKEIEKLEGSLKDLTKTSGGAAKGLKEAEKAAEALRKELESPLVNAVGSISNAFGDFVARGLTDFKGFVQSILGSFKNMIAQMIAMAVKNRIMLSLGIGGITPTMAAAGQVAGLGSAGGMLGSLGIGKGIGGLAGGTGFLGGAGNAIAGLGGGGAGLFSVGANAAAAGGGFLATAGAAVPILGAAALALSFFKKKVTELDNGIKVTATGLDTLVQSFKTVQTSQFFGLSKKVSTTFGEASPELEQAVNAYQNQLLAAVDILEISKDAFKDFSYELQISLKGLTEEQKLEKVNQELGKFGDALAGLTEFGNATSLLYAAQSLRDFIASLTPAQKALYDMQKGLNSLRQISQSGDFSNAAEIVKKVGGVIGNIGRAITETVRGLKSSLGSLAEINNVTTQFEKALSIGSQVREFESQAVANLNRAANGIEKVGRFLAKMKRSGEFSEEDLSKLSRRLRNQTKALKEADLIVAAVSKVSDVYDKTVDAILAKPVDDAIAGGLLPKYMESFSASVKSIITTVEKGDLDSFANAYVNIVSMFGKGEISAIELSNSVQIMSEIVDGTTKSVNEFGQEFQKTINIIEDALKRLAGIREEVAPRESRQAALSYLRDVSSSGIKPAADAIFEQAVATVSNVSTGDFASQVEMLRYIAETSALLSNIKGFATGGSFGGGMRVVGENGPELEITGPSRIYSKQQTKEILGGSGSNDSEALRVEVSQMRQELTAGLIQIAKNTGKTAATLNKFDYDGLPDSRGY